MGKLTEPRYRDKYTKSSQNQFLGLNMRKGARDGEIADMVNMSSREFPLLCVRAKRRLCATLEKPNGLFGWNGLVWVDGTKFYFNGVEKGTVTDSVKSFAGIGAYIVIMPDKKYYNTETDSFGSMESEWSGTELTFTNGTLYGEAAERNALKHTGTDWSEYFREGDAVTVSGCTVHPENNKSVIIREISGDTMNFYENVFVLDGEEQSTEYGESGTIKVSRSVPELDWMCENENRLWGCKGNTIYASKLGDIFNFGVYDGIDTDSYTVETGSVGEFTGCVSYAGYPTFFKDENIYKVYGSIPSNFEVASSVKLGMESGNGGSLATAGETLFFLSRAGFAAYTGGIPTLIHDAFGENMPQEATAGSDGVRYYVSCRMPDGAWRLFVYDTRYGVWDAEDNTHAVCFAYYGGELYFLSDDGKIWLTEDKGRTHPGSTEENSVSWSVEFADFTAGETNKKSAGKLQLRIELEQGSEARAYIRYDSSGTWTEIYPILTGTTKKSFILPVIPKRCDHYRIKLTGSGEGRIYALTRSFYVGSEHQSRED